MAEFEEILNSINNVAEGEATGEPSAQENNTKKSKKATNTPKASAKNGKSVKHGYKRKWLKLKLVERKHRLQLKFIDISKETISK